MSETTIVKRCGCGRAYARGAWGALPLLGAMRSRGDELWELRQCACGSSIAVPVPVASGVHEVRGGAKKRARGGG